MIRLSKKMALVAPSATKAMTAMAADLRATGRRIITLSQGEPDFPTPQRIREAAIRAITEGHTTYTPVAGILPLREAICEKFARENSLHYAPDQITVGCGAKQVLFNALLATLDPGDEVIFPVPAWVSYPEMIKLAGGTPVAVETFADAGFILSPEALAAAITPRTRWLMLNSPCNPTGAVYSAANLDALAEVARANPEVMVLSDDIYEHLVYSDATFATMASVAPDLAGRILTVNGVSKSYAMTGWRVGYGAGPLALIKAMNTVQGQSTSHTSSISQHAALEALRGDQGFIEDFRKSFDRRRHLVCDAINAIPDLRCYHPAGAFYVFVEVSSFIGRKSATGFEVATDDDLAIFLLETAGVATVPGSGFLAPGFLRLSYATSDDLLMRALSNIRAALAGLQ